MTIPMSIYDYEDDTRLINNFATIVALYVLSLY